jgi:hypothetical protein
VSGVVPCKASDVEDDTVTTASAAAACKRNGADRFRSVVKRENVVFDRFPPPAHILMVKEISPNIRRLNLFCYAFLRAVDE